MEVTSRAEEYLNYALKNQEDYPEPISRMDYYLLSVAQEVRSGGSGTTNYADLTNKPSINGVELSGNKTLADLGIDITTTIGPMSTHNQVPSAKTMYDTLKITLIGSKQLSAYGKEIVKYPLGRWGTMGMGVKNLTDLPNDDVKYVEILGISDSATPWTVGLSTRTYRATTEDGAIFTRSITSGDKGGVIEKDTGWQKVCYTKIPDVPVTKITITDKTNYNNLYSAQLSYCVVSGICYISGGVECLTPPQGNVQIATLPKPSMGYQYFRTICTNTSKIEDIDHVRYMIGLNGEFRLIKGLAGGEYRGTFSYPVAES